MTVKSIGPEANRTLYWEITDICGLRCKYCWYQKRALHKKRKVVGLNFLETIPVIASQFNEVVFTGGEVLDHPYLIKLIQKVYDQGLKFTLITNGIGLQNKLLEEIMDFKPMAILISLDSLNTQINDWQRPPAKSNSHDISRKIIQNICEYSNKYNEATPCTILQTITRYNINCISDMFDFARQHGIRHLIRLAEIDGRRDELAKLGINNWPEKDLTRFYTLFLDWAQQVKTIDYYNIVMYLLGKIKNLKVQCTMGRSNFFLDLEGNLHPCFHRREIKFGNILTDDLIKMLSIDPGQEKINPSCLCLGCACLCKLENSY